MVLKNKKRFGHFFFNLVDELWAYQYDNLHESALLRNRGGGGGASQEFVSVKKST